MTDPIRLTTGARGRPLTLQAYFDDSGAKGQGRWMVMSGLFGEAELFASIASEWDKYLAARYPGRIRYFKMDEACTLDGEFRHWQPANRDAKVWQMSKLVDRGDLVEIAARINLAAWGRIAARWTHVKPQHGQVQKFHSMSQPYMMLFQYALVTATTEAVARGATDPIEIIFDEQSLFQQSARACYPDLREIERDDPSRLSVLPVQPWFRDDKECVMLQAADMLAGELRLVAEDYPNNPEFVGKLCPNLTVSRHFADIDDQVMDGYHEHLTVELEREQREADSLHKQSLCGD